MTTSELAALIGKTVRVEDRRTSAIYPAKVIDAKKVFGSLRLAVSYCQFDPSELNWFEPTKSELDSLLTVTQENLK